MDKDTDYLYNCNGCEKTDEPIAQIEYHRWARNDAYGYFTGLYCEKCYQDPTKYTYRKDRYFDER